MNLRQGLRERIRGSPVLRCEKGEADFAGGEGDVGVGDSGVEADCGRCVGVIWGDCY